MLCNTCNENINTKTTINSFTIIHFFGTLVLYQDWRGLLCVPSAARALLLRLQWPPISPCSRKSSLYLQWQRKRDGEREREKGKKDSSFRQEILTVLPNRKQHQSSGFSLTSNNPRGVHWPLMTSAGTPQVQVQVYGPAEAHMTGALQRGTALEKRF